MVCPKCSTTNQDDSNFCRNCGTPISARVGTPVSLGAGAAAAPSKANGLGWHKFLINFSFFAMALLLLGNAISWIGIFSETAGSIKLCGFLFAFLFVALAGFAIYLRFQLAKFKKNAYILLMILYVAFLLVNCGYPIVFSLISGFSWIGEESISSLLGLVAVAVYNSFYYSKRLDLFTN